MFDDRKTLYLLYVSLMECFSTLIYNLKYVVVINTNLRKHENDHMYNCLIYWKIFHEKNRKYLDKSILPVEINSKWIHLTYSKHCLTGYRPIVWQQVKNNCIVPLKIKFHYWRVVVSFKIIIIIIIESNYLKWNLE